MPYPLHPPRKHPDLPPSEARAAHLVPYQFRPGQSANPGGLSKSQRELYLEAKQLAHRAGPGAIRRLAELAGVPLEGEEWVPLAQLDIDPRLIYMSATALAERAYGKPKEFDPEQEVRAAGRIDFSRLAPEEIEAIAAAAQLLARARVQPSAAEAGPQVIDGQGEPAGFD
jgi:hypothetical protein